MPRRYWSVLAAAIGCWALLALPGSSVAGIAEHARGGAAAVGPKAQPKAVQDRLRTLNLTWYYDYSPRLEDEAPGTHKVAVLRGGEKNRTPLDQVAAQARSRPGHYWIIFNEPDLEGQDAVSDEFLQGRGQQRFEYYAQLFHDYVATLKQADPTARVVAPNLFNWQGSYREWVVGFREAHRSRYGEEPSVDVWGLHLYSFDPDWQKLPVLDLAYARVSTAISATTSGRSLATSPPRSGSRRWARSGATGT